MDNKIEEVMFGNRNVKDVVRDINKLMIDERVCFKMLDNYYNELKVECNSELENIVLSFISKTSYSSHEYFMYFELDELEELLLTTLSVENNLYLELQRRGA